MAIPDNCSNSYNDSEAEIFGNNIIILKKVKSLRQLRRTEKELVRLNYKEAIIKGFTLKGIQQYIASKTKIWIEWSCLEYLKKAEEQENREWYYRLAKDHFAHIGIYRECIDEIQQLKKENWRIVMDPKVDHSIRIQAAKELHSLSKTSVLLLRDLLFVANLSKYYDISKFDNTLHDKLSSPHTSDNNKIFNDSLKKEDVNELKKLDNQINFNGVKDKEIAGDNLKDNTEHLQKNNNLDNKIMEDMAAQIHIPGSLKGKSIDEITDQDWDKIISPEHKGSIKKFRQLLDN